MAITSDYVLDLHMVQIEKSAVHSDVKGAIGAVLGYARSGRGGHRRGGPALVRLLEDARRLAASTGEWHVVRLLQDSIDYAQGLILQPEFDERYRLFRDGIRNDRLRRHVSEAVSLKYWLAAADGRKYLDAHPEAGAEEVLGYIRSLAEDARFLEAPRDRPGRYRIPRGRADLVMWLERVLEERVDIENTAQTARRILASADTLARLAEDDEGRMVLRAVELRRRSQGLASLRRAVEDRTASERDLQRALEGQPWIFGGQFISESARRRLVPGDEVDISLIRGDGALHIVELKRSMSLVGPLVKRHRNAWVPAGNVHDAVSQAVNYLVGLDENRRRIRDEFGIETRRASALVLIGHPAVQPNVPEETINEALRTLNAHMSRVDVLTYKELVDSADRSLGDVERP
ncbi:Shedu anti-phage system protein SduA domain-containing protein [Streptomyces sp. NPDC087420]|uniref:Shedu anti-phage system protein SduA domain-containing protein n=1 Tax=Streptomyces sp. NPDC087420 TaxID=3365785 RepID=UPI0038387D24